MKCGLHPISGRSGRVTLRKMASTVIAALLLLTSLAYAHRLPHDNQQIVSFEGYHEIDGLTLTKFSWKDCGTWLTKCVKV